jgi:hypothetical protein
MASSMKEKLKKLNAGICETLICCIWRRVHLSSVSTRARFYVTQKRWLQP